ACATVGFPCSAISSRSRSVRTACTCAVEVGTTLTSPDDGGEPNEGVVMLAPTSMVSHAVPCFRVPFMSPPPPVPTRARTLSVTVSSVNPRPLVLPRQHQSSRVGSWLDGCRSFAFPAVGPSGRLDRACDARTLKFAEERGGVSNLRRR